MRKILLLILFAAFGALVGCSHPGKHLPAGSYERGLAEYDGERYYDAIEDLKLFIRRNPTDERVDDAQYHIGLARMDDEDYPVAAVEFEILRSDYPNSDLVEDAWYKEGLCYVEQVPSLHLEQTVTLRALAHFRRYLREYPAGKHQEAAQKQVDELQSHIDRKRFAAIELYRRLNRPRAALVSIGAMLEERPDTKLRPRLLYEAGELHSELDENTLARESWATLVRDHPDDDFAQQARRRLEGLPPLESEDDGNGR